MKLATIHHVAIIVSDYEKPKDLRVVRALCEKASVKRVNDRKLAVCDIWHSGWMMWKLCSRTGTDGDGCEPIRLDSYTQKKMTFFFDPDGLPLELHE